MSTFYLFHGDDDLRIDEEVGAMLAKMREQPNGDLNTAEFDGTQTSIPELLGAALAYPFLADKRLVIVRGMISWITRKGAGETGKSAVAALIEALPTLPDWARVVFVERGKLTNSNKILKLAQTDPNGYAQSLHDPEGQHRLDRQAGAGTLRRADRTGGCQCARQRHGGRFTPGRQ